MYLFISTIDSELNICSKALLSFLLVFSSSIATAEMLFQPYLGLSVSHFDIEGEKSFDNRQFFDADKSDDSFGVVLGARVFEVDRVYVELEYNYDYIDANVDTSDTLSGNEGFNEVDDIHLLAINLHYGFTEHDSVYARLGVGYGNFSTEGAIAPLKHSFDETGYLYGIGYRRELSEHWSVRLDYSIIEFDPDTKKDSNGAVMRVEDIELDELSLVVMYSF